ncbi:MAG TPA: hypothetical protein VH760_04390 [Gaiellaceae bacterium]|jgi:hypothetical protein
MSYDTWYRVHVAGLNSERRDSSGARVPSVAAGTAIVFTRYDEEKAVVLNPQDFRRLKALDDDLDEITSASLALTPLALKAHALEDAPGTAVEDAVRIKALLGL